VLAQPRPTGLKGRLLAIDPKRRAGSEEFTAVAIDERMPHPAGGKLGIGEHVRHVVDRRRRHTRLLTDHKPLGDWPGGEPGVDL
jgi:hypothetical protein